MSLAIFDLDETLISTDSDHAWGEFIVDQGLVDKTAYRETNEAFYKDYLRGELDIESYLVFCCSILSRFELSELHALRVNFVDSIIAPTILPKAVELVETHRSAGDFLMVITSTNQFITEPIVEKFGIETLIAPEPEIKNGRYTGQILDTPSYGMGKVIRLNKWLGQHPLIMEGSYFYTDSHNDLPLLRMVDNPVAVDPDNILRKEAEQSQWQIISLR